MNTVSAPFKFLDAYQEKDSEIFFGREEETAQLYHALSGVKHLLVYGPSGAGKTSLIECGLRNQFSDADWYAITIRRRQNIVQDVFESINSELEEAISMDPITGLPVDQEINFGQAVEQLFDECFQPVYLLFDQFEELLLLGSQQEKEDFFARLNKLIKYRVPCRVLLVMREEFIGHLSEFEYLCPSLFRYRFRLEKMARSKVWQVVYQILITPQYAHAFSVVDSEELADRILSKLPDEKREIELTHVQVFLSELWDRAWGRIGEKKIPVLDASLIHENDDLQGVLDAFLKKQLQELENKHGKKVALEVLAAMISERHTKLQVTMEELQGELTRNSIQLQIPLAVLLEDLMNRRIIRTLRSSDENRYEITHDLLAFIVGENLTEEMQLREKANDIYRVYGERKGYFSQEELDYLRPYQQYKDYPDDLAERIVASQAYLKEQRDEELKAAQVQAQKEQDLRSTAEENARRARIRTLIASIVALVAFVAAGTAGYFYQEAEKEKDNAEVEQERAERFALIAQDSATAAIEQRQITERILLDLKQAQLQFNLAQAEAFAERDQYEDALDALQNALTFTDSIPQRVQIERRQQFIRSEQRNFEFQAAREKGLRLVKIDECKAAQKYLKRAAALAPSGTLGQDLANALTKCK